MNHGFVAFLQRTVNCQNSKKSRRNYIGYADIRSFALRNKFNIKKNVDEVTSFCCWAWEIASKRNNPLSTSVFPHFFNHIKHNSEKMHLKNLKITNPIDSLHYRTIFQSPTENIGFLKKSAVLPTQTINHTKFPETDRSHSRSRHFVNFLHIFTIKRSRTENTWTCTRAWRRGFELCAISKWRHFLLGWTRSRSTFTFDTAQCRLPKRKSGQVECTMAAH